MKHADVVEFIQRYFHAALQETDLDRFAALFTEDGVLEDPVGTPPLRGREAIREFVRAGRAQIERASATVHDVYVCGDEAAVRWSMDLQTRRGGRVAIAGIGIFAFAGPDALRHVREYHDVTQLMRVLAGDDGAAAE